MVDWSTMCFAIDSSSPRVWRLEVTVADPAVGTGTFLLGILRRIAATVEANEALVLCPRQSMPPWGVW